MPSRQQFEAPAKPDQFGIQISRDCLSIDDDDDNDDTDKRTPLPSSLPLGDPR